MIKFAIWKVGHFWMRFDLEKHAHWQVRKFRNAPCWKQLSGVTVTHPRTCFLIFITFIVSKTEKNNNLLRRLKSENKRPDWGNRLNHGTDSKEYSEDGSLEENRLRFDLLLHVKNNHEMWSFWYCVWHWALPYEAVPEKPWKARVFGWKHPEKWNYSFREMLEDVQETAPRE